MSDIDRINSGAAVQLWTPTQLDIIREQIAPDTTDEELGLFAEVCRATGLNPFAKQIYAIVRTDKKAARGKRMTIQTGIDGLRLIASRTGLYDGQDAPEWCADDGVWRDTWISHDPPAAARVRVYRSGARPFAGVAMLAERAQSWNGELTGQWRSMPAHMLAKIAEADALRKAFPAEMAGLYTDDELGPDGRPAEAGPVDPPAPVTRVVNIIEREQIGAAAASAGLVTTEVSAIIRRVGGVENSKQLPAAKLGVVLEAIAAWQPEPVEAVDIDMGDTA